MHGPASGILALQGLAGNQAVVSMLRAQGRVVQREPMRAALGTKLGWVSSPNEPVGTALSAISEYVPPGQRAGAFAGFKGEYAATLFARNQATVCAVAKDAEGRFHVFDTGLPGGSFPGSTGRAGNMSLKRDDLRKAPHIRVIRWMNLGERFQFGRWARLRGEAIKARKRYREASQNQRVQQRRAAERVYVELLMEVYGVERSEVHVASSASDLVPDKINFDLDLGSHGQTEPTSLPKSRDQEAPAGTIAIGPSALTASSPFAAQGTLIHEETHLAHHERARALWEKWRRSRTRRTFSDWLKTQSVSAVDYELAVEKATIRTETDPAGRTIEIGETANSEALAHLADFAYTYQRVDPQSQAAREAFLDLSTSPSPRARGVAEWWINADDAVKKNVIESLRAYYQKGMDKEHRRAFIEFAAKKRDESASRAKSDFIDALLLPFFKELANFNVRVPAPRR